MTAKNETAAEVPCVRIPLRTTYVSPATPETTIFIYSSNTDKQGNVELHLSDVANGEEEKTCTSSLFAKLKQDQGSYTISYQDETNTVLQPNNVDTLMGAAALQTNDDNVNMYDLFKNEVKEEPELILSPTSLVNGAVRIAEYNNTQSITNENAPSNDDTKTYSDSKSPSSGKKMKPKVSSPNGWGPQQCSICSKVFGNTSALAKHKLTHSDERKYGCVTCGKAFKRQDHLNGHMLTHRHKKPFECKADGCGKSYCDARSLRRHTENHHIHPSLPITTPTISVQEVISNTSTIPTCIQYAPKGTQSFQKSNTGSSAIKLPKITATAVSAADQCVLLKSSQTNSRGQKGNLMKSDSDDCLTRNSVSETERLTREQFELIERIMYEQGEKLKFEQNQQKSLSQQQQSQQQSQPQQRGRQSTGASHEETSLSLPTSSSSSPSANPSPVVANSTVKLTLTSVLLRNNNIKLLLQKGNTRQGTNTNSSNTPIVAKHQSTKETKSQSEQNKPESKQVECNLCHRKFKNVPALNGHMRLHGGYFKKENDAKKLEKRESNGPQLTTASISVRALIEEKIIQKRTTALNGIAKLNPASQAILKPKLKQNENLSPKTTNESKDTSTTNGYHAKASSFALPAALTPQQQISLSINAANYPNQTNVEEENYSPSLQAETLMFNELLLKRANQKSVKRASSDPGIKSYNTHSPQIDVNFSPENAYLDVYSNQNDQYFTNNLADEMFQSVRESESMLLTNVDTTTELNNLSQIQNSDFQEINLEEYESDLQQQQDLQAVLNSPLPVSLAEFPYIQTENVIANRDQTIPYSHSQSPLSSPSFTYPTPPASQEGHSPSFGQVTSIVHHNRVSSPLSATFYSSGMSSPGAVEAALNEVLPMDGNQNIYPSPSSPSTITVTPEPSPVSLSTPPFSSQGDLYQPHSQEADDALLSNQEEFEETYKFIEREGDLYDSAAQQYQNVILNCSRLIESDSPYGPRDAATISGESSCGRNVTLRTPDRENITLYADDSVDDRCHITFHPATEANAAKITFHADPADVATARSAATVAYDNRDDMNFHDGADLNFQGVDNGKESLFYDKDISFHVYAQNRGDITLHSENQGPVILHSDDRGNMIIHDDRYNLGHAFRAEGNNNYEGQRITFDSVVDRGGDDGGGRHAENITLHIADANYDQKVTFTPAVKECEHTFIVHTSPSVTATGTISNSRKRHMIDDYKHKFPQRSRLRVHRHASHMLHYTPCPMLNPLRNSTGLYWQACLATITNNQKGEGFGRDVPKNELLIESDEDPHINVGAHFQAVVEARRENPHPGKLTIHDGLVWEPAIKHGIMDKELDMYLEFACCAALPGGGRNKEYALHVLHLCQGNIHEAVLKLMQPKLHVSSDHPLLTNPYPDSDAWNSEEIEMFQQSIVKFDKNFTRIAQHIETKSAKQCVQFYYLWKKACPEEYERYRLNWKRIRELNMEKTTSIIPISNMNVASEVEVISTASDTRPFACEFPECLARFNSRAALNGHNRIHGGSADRWRMVTSTNVTNVNSTCSSDIVEEFPCKLCGKVFSKIKSRSAHMKSHRPTEVDHKKPKMEIQ